MLAVPVEASAVASPCELTLITEGLSDVQEVTLELTLRTPVSWELLRKKLSRTFNLRDVPFGMDWGLAGLRDNRTGPTDAGSCAQARAAQSPSRRTQKAFR